MIEFGISLSALAAGREAEMVHFNKEIDQKLLSVLGEKNRLIEFLTRKLEDQKSVWKNSYAKHRN
jgi:hypothetical protein